MSDFDLQMVREDLRRAAPPLPESFTLVAYESPYVLSTSDSRPPLVIDAEGVTLISGAVYTWCRTGCCGSNPRQWPSVEAAADYHGSYIVARDGSIQTPDHADG